MTAVGAMFVLISFIGLFSTIITVYHLALFLSYYESTDHASKFFNGGHEHKTEHTWASILLKDLILLSLFILQHSLMALPAVKQTFEKYRMGAIQRSLYVISTCLSLQCLMRLWEPTSTHVWWSVIGSGHGLRILWRITHILSWLLIYIGSLVLDLLELLGIRQVYNALNSLPPPLDYKSKELQRFYQHMRHPSLCGLFAIFWLCPVMTTDRMLLAVIWTGYMAARWTVDKEDFDYQKRQHIRKFDQLSDLNLKNQFT